MREKREGEEEEEEEEERGEMVESIRGTSCNPPCGSLLPFFIGDLCFIRLSERKTRFPSSPQ